MEFSCEAFFCAVDMALVQVARGDSCAGSEGSIGKLSRVEKNLTLRLDGLQGSCVDVVRAWLALVWHERSPSVCVFWCAVSFVYSVLTAESGADSQHASVCACSLLLKCESVFFSVLSRSVDVCPACSRCYSLTSHTWCGHARYNAHPPCVHRDGCRAPWEKHQIRHLPTQLVQHFFSVALSSDASSLSTWTHVMTKESCGLMLEGAETNAMTVDAEEMWAHINTRKFDFG